MPPSLLEFPHTTFYSLDTPQGQADLSLRLSHLPDDLQLAPWTNANDPSAVFQQATDRGIIAPDAYDEQKEELSLVRSVFPDHPPITGMGIMAEMSYRTDNRFVHVLPHPEFRQVLFSRNYPTYSQETQQAIFGGRVAVAGLSVGSNIALALASMGFENFTLADPDHVSLSNLIRLPWADISTIGRPKTVALARTLLDLNPYIQITAHEKLVSASSDSQHIAASQLMTGASLVIEAVDRLGPKVAIHQAAERLSLPVIMASDLGTAGAVSIDLPGQRPFGGRLTTEELEYLINNPNLSPQEFINYAAKMIGPTHIPSEFLASLGKTPWIPQPHVAAMSGALLAETAVAMMLANQPVRTDASINVRQTLAFDVT